jgi:hypothetical protein
MDDVIQRRHLLRNVGLVAGGAATASGLGAVVAPASARHPHGGGRRGRRRLLGSWVVERTEGDGTVTLVGSFAAGGVIVVHDIDPAGPPVTGTWRMLDRNSWRATLWTGFPGEEGPGSPGPTARLRIFGEVRRRRIRGTYEVTFFAPDGSELGAGGTFVGRPIEA